MCKKKIAIILPLILAVFTFIIPMQIKAEKVMETIYDYKPIDDYTVKKDGTMTGWKWKKKKSTLIGTKYQWNKNGKVKKVKKTVIKHQYIKDIAYGKYGCYKDYVYCGDQKQIEIEKGHGFRRGNGGLLSKQLGRRIYFILYSYVEKKYYYLIMKENGKLLYDGVINFEQLTGGSVYQNPEHQNISDFIVLSKNKIAITYQIEWKEGTNAVSGVDCIDIKTKEQKRLFQAGTETYTALSYDGKRILAVVSDQKELYIIDGKSKKIMVKPKLPDTKLKLPKEADETYDSYAKDYLVGLCENKIYYLDNLKGIFVCDLKEGKNFQRMKGAYSYVTYKYPMIDQQLRCFKQGKKTAIYVTYLTYGHDECLKEEEIEQYSKLIRYDI